MAKRTWKNAPAGNRRSAATKRAPSQPVLPKSAVPTSTFKSSGDARRDSLMQQIEAAQNALNRESASGFGARSERAAKHLDSLNKQLADYDSSGFGPQAVEIAKTAVPAVIGGVGGVKLAGMIGRTQTARANAGVKRFNAVAKHVERIRTTAPGPVIGTRAGDKMIALVNEGHVLGGSRAPFKPSGAPRLFQSARPLFAKAGGKFGLGLFLGLAAEGVASRYVLPNYTTDKTLKDGLAISGTASMAAAATYLFKRKIDMAKAVSLRPEGTTIAKVTAAHSQILREQALKVAPSRAAALRVASRVILPVAVGAAALLAFSRASKAGEGTGRALVKGFGAGANEAAMGVPEMAEGYFKGRGEGGVSGFIASAVVRAVRSGGATVSGLRASIARRGAAQSVSVNRPLARRGSAPVRVSNGRVESYYRVQGGKSVFVHGYTR